MADYNSAYTGAQIDEAIGEVLTKAESWDNKASLVDGKVPEAQLPEIPTSLTDFGVTATATELNYCDGLTGNIQGQIDDLFTSVSDGKVGDVRITARTDLGANWVLCDGSAVDPFIYAAYADVAPAKPGSKFGVAAQISSGDLATTERKRIFKFLNNEYVVLSRTKIYRSDALNGEWEVISPQLGDLFDIAYGNGFYVVAVYQDLTERVYYSENLNGPWTIATFSAGLYGANSVIFANNKFMVSGDRNSSCYFSTAENPSDTWLVTVVEDYSTSGYQCTAGCLIATADYIVIGGSVNSGTATYWYSSDGIDWVRDRTVSSAGTFRCMVEYDGKIYAVAYKGTSTRGGLYRIDNVGSNTISSELLASVQSLGVYEDYLCVPKSQNISFYNSEIKLIAESDISEISSLFTGSGGVITGILEHDGNLLGAFGKGNNTDPLVIGILSPNLPNITFDGAYAYVKVKEGSNT